MKGVVVKVSLWNRRSGNVQLSLAKTNAAAKAKRDGSTFTAAATVGAGVDSDVGAEAVTFTLADAYAIVEVAFAEIVEFAALSPPWT